LSGTVDHRQGVAAACPAPVGRPATRADNNFRDGPNGVILDVRPAGEAVTVLDHQPSWLKVRLADDRDGWMNDQYVYVY
jgi:SH3 domain-containing protein